MITPRECLPRKTRAVSRIARGGVASHASDEPVDAFEDRGSRGEGLAERCYQTCYHFPEKAARNKMNQGPSGWVMSLK